VRQRHTDRVHDERRRDLDSIEKGEGVPSVKKEMLEEENILEKCEENRQESDKEENEDVDIKEEPTDCDTVILTVISKTRTSCQRAPQLPWRWTGFEKWRLRRRRNIRINVHL